MSLTRPAPYQPDVIENYALLCRSIGITKADVVIVNYCHGDGICYVNRDNGGNGLLYSNELPPCDALITNIRTLALFTIHADCSCYHIYDPVHNAIGACHAGWKGTLLRIGEKTVHSMHERFGTIASDCIIGIGPNISFERFEVDYPVAQQFDTEYGESIIKQNGNKYQVDLTGCAIEQFLHAGVSEKNIVVSGECTYSNPSKYYSFRRDGVESGAMVGVLMLK